MSNVINLPATYMLQEIDGHHLRVVQDINRIAYNDYGTIHSEVEMGQYTWGLLMGIENQFAELVYKKVLGRAYE